jgi:DNA-binding transcriptional MerR regulator
MALPAQKVGFQPRSIKLLTIGQVLSALKSDFGDLTPSKLRFLEEQELVCPQRTASGYRKYTDLDVDRIRIILELQRDKYLPLKVIRQYLEDLEAGKNPSLPGSSSPVAEHLRISNKVKFTELDLISATGITPALIAEARNAQLLNQEPFEAADIEIARSIMHLQRFGLQPRHLRGLKSSADREIGIIEGVIAPVLAKSDVSSRSRAVHYGLEIANQFASIHAELVRSALSKLDS